MAGAAACVEPDHWKSRNVMNVDREQVVRSDSITYKIHLTADIFAAGNVEVPVVSTSLTCND